MIQLPLVYDSHFPFWYNALFLYSAALAAIAAAIWIYAEVTTRRTHRILEKQFLWRCVFCGYTYLDESAESLSQCPRCSSFNSIEDRYARFVHTTALAPVEDQPEAPPPPRRNPSHRKHPHKRRRGPRKR